MRDTAGKVYLVRRLSKDKKSGWHGPHSEVFYTKNPWDSEPSKGFIQKLGLRIPYGDAFVCLKHYKNHRDKSSRVIKILWGNQTLYGKFKKHQIDKSFVTPYMWEKLGHDKRLENFMKLKEMDVLWFSCGLNDRISEEFQVLRKNNNLADAFKTHWYENIKPCATEGHIKNFEPVLLNA